MSVEDTTLVPVTETDTVDLSAQRKFNAVQRYMALGNMRAVSELENISYHTLVEWKRSDWWPDMVEEVRRVERARKVNRLEAIAERALGEVEDRLKNGDTVLNNKTGRIVRKPVSARDASKIASDMMTHQEKLEELSQKMDVEKDTVAETLKTLANEFAKFNKKLNRASAETIEFKEKE